MEKKKSISREQIIKTTLNLLHDKKELRGVNLREIARTLGCAHTNLYNYFPSFTDLLWATHTALQEVFMMKLKDNLSSATTAEMKLKYFFNTFLQVYLDNTGWFRLAWLEYIGEDRPESDVAATKAASEELNQYVLDIWQELSESKVDNKKVSETMHNTHCYIIGEVSNYISGRGLIENEAEFKNHVVSQAIKILTLCLREE
ncbi:transcriptional regulator, TetR family [Anaerovirgula multivorans]|uniref:Transcriptional regulator, TetR family n=1 Tax=Anaerovirgula multivorans TaxID=312168 RepID=A0A239I8B3_9FIRM|nr:TetR/AcrR family transcriptional regulator [Anaerovirgula multivorans]SNS88564.1 transcriptional regulator, TetR family [Anaerovirgula multivorans]